MPYENKTISELIMYGLNNNTFLPAIQREYVWDTAGVEKLFDSIMGDFPIGSFLFWRIREEQKKDWASYTFVSDYDAEHPYNKEARLSGINKDICLVLDGQQRLTSLFIGLRGSYRYRYYGKWRKTQLYLNLLKAPVVSGPDELTYEFKFRENDKTDNPSLEYWYPVGDILDSEDPVDAQTDLMSRISSLDEELQKRASKLVFQLHTRIHTTRHINYYEEKSQDYDKVVEVFIRANTGGVKLEYSDILLSTAVANWSKDNLNAKEEIHSFTDSINAIGNGYTFGKDFVLKGCLYLTDGLPIKYQVKNFNATNLKKIRENWEEIKFYLGSTIRLISKFGYNDKNVISKNALLPIALYLKKLGKTKFVESGDKQDVDVQDTIRKWLTIVILKNAFGGSTDTILKALQDTLEQQSNFAVFPWKEFNSKIGLDVTFNDSEISELLQVKYGSKLSYLILTLLYPDRDWKDNKYQQDHIFPKTEFSTAKLSKRNYAPDKIEHYQGVADTIVNLQLLTAAENQEKSSSLFENWFSTRDTNFQTRHKIPVISSYGFDNFLEFVAERKKILDAHLRKIVMQ